MTQLLHDFRYAVRSLAKARGFAAVAILTLAVALGANTAIFTLVNAILLRPLPYGNADRVIKAWSLDLKDGSKVGQLSYPNIVDLGKRMKSVEAISAYSGSGSFFMDGEEPELFEGTDIEAAGLPILGVKPALGRLFTAAEDRKGAENVLLISDELWHRRFNAQKNIIGRTLHLGTARKPWTVIGVMPPGFRFPADREKVDYYSPLGPTLSDQDRSERNSVWLDTIALMRKGTTVAAADKEAEFVSQQLAKQYPDSNTGVRFLMQSIHDAVVGDVQPALLTLFGAVAVVLLIGCANVANLLLARAAARHKEISIRSALGASRGTIVRQLLVESVLLALIAGACGLLLAAWGVDALVALAPHDIPRLDNVALDGRVLLFTFTLSILTGVIFGLAPALSASKTDLTEALKEGSRGSTEGRRRNRIRNVLVTVAVALSLVLLSGAGLLLRTFMGLVGIDPGFNYKNVAVLRVPARAAYKDDAQVADFHRRLHRELAAVPGAKSVGGVTVLPLSGGQLIYSFEIVGRPPFPRGEGPSITTSEVTPNFFQTMGIPLLRGRDIAPTDTLTSPGVVVVNEAFVKEFFPGENPIGRKLAIGNGDDIKENEIVGIAGNVKFLKLTEEPMPMFYLPVAQTVRRSVSYVIRADNPEALFPALRNAVRRLDRQQPILSLMTLEQMRGEMLAERKFTLVLLIGLAALALVLAAVGIYSIMSYTVTQRTSEIGIRMALGAEARDIFRLVVGQAVKLVGIGLVVGVIVAVLGTRLMGSLLYGVEPGDPITLAAICIVIAAVALIASWIPARRAARVDPLVAIRYT
ncbi:MAG TPA: ABC transporter permease [Thermoanaerobaculia bacterium]|nr:ABC transporter permease [Thermoanaerobaculia bacterium]